MNCPKCKANIGAMKHEIMLDSGVVHCTLYTVHGALYVVTGPNRIHCLNVYTKHD
jgi:hypothetical protein